MPGGLRLYITADTRYQLHVNGRFVGRGPPQSQPYFQYYDQQDVSRCLTQGLNCVGVIVNYVGNLPDTRGGLLAELADADGNVLLATDAGWRVCRAAAWQEHTFMFRMNKATPYQEVFDARRFPAGWSEAGFDDSQWQPGRVIAGRISDRPPAVQKAKVRGSSDSRRASRPDVGPGAPAGRGCLRPGRLHPPGTPVRTMKPFEELTQHGKAARLRRLADAAPGRCGVRSAGLTFLDHFRQDEQDCHRAVQNRPGPAGASRPALAAFRRLCRALQTVELAPTAKPPEITNPVSRSLIRRFPPPAESRLD